jgi:hypothetical protein
MFSCRCDSGLPRLPGCSSRRRIVCIDVIPVRHCRLWPVRVGSGPMGSRECRPARSGFEQVQNVALAGRWAMRLGGFIEVGRLFTRGLPVPALIWPFRPRSCIGRNLISSRSCTVNPRGCASVSSSMNRNVHKMQGLRCPACRTQSVHLKPRIVKARQNG